MHDFYKLDVWHKARTLVKSVYEVISKLPKEELFGLASQIKRSCISIPSNIAEGCGKGSDKQFKYHLEVALGSSFELNTQLLLEYDLNYISIEEKDLLIHKVEEVSKMINGLINCLIKKI